MRKPFIIIVVGLLIILAFTLGAYAADPIKLIVNGQEMKPAVPPQVINGSTMVPVRFISEALGANVEWDSNTQSILISNKPSFLSGNAMVRNMFPGALINSAYLSIGIPDNPSQQQQQALSNMLISKGLEMFDGIHILYEAPNGEITRRITINMNDIMAWKTGQITDREYFARWQDTANAALDAGSSLPSNNSDIAPPGIISDIIRWQAAMPVNEPFPAGTPTLDRRIADLRTLLLLHRASQYSNSELISKIEAIKFGPNAVLTLDGERFQNIAIMVQRGILDNAEALYELQLLQQERLIK